ncbi:UNVERIFIED_CONTAM: hypothetical protein GTU68_065394 [Idotea baltica]|nr:hypothetical protein [Idotea baltica]
MGTTYNVSIVHLKSSNFDKKTLKSEFDNLLIEVNQQVSTYIPDSEISLFNDAKNINWMKIDSDFYQIVSAAQKVSQLSNGAFDITISPLIDAWGFGAKDNKNPPNDTEIKVLLEEIGYQQLAIDDKNLSIKKEQASLRIDLSAIAKGFAVDKLSQYLSEKGFPNHLVEIGGELRANGTNLSDNNWRIAVEQPDPSSNIANKGIELSNKGVATSGDYRNYFIENGVRRSHIIDPNTGYPITHKLASVTVLHESTMLADAYATAILVMGEKLGKIFAEKNNLDVLMIIRENDKFKFWSSSNLFK